MSFKPKNPRIPRIILLVESSRGSGRALLRGIANYAHHHGPWSFYWEPGGLEKAWPALREMEADGIILRDVEKVDEVIASQLPAVVIGHRQSEIPGLVNVVTDSEAIGRMGAEHLIRCGFKQFAFCGYCENALEKTVWSQVRGEFFSNHILQARFPKPSHYSLFGTGHDWSRERRALARWLASLPKPVGLMACNDDCGQQVIEACKLASLRIPDEVGVIGADNDEVVCGLTDPPLSSVAINFDRAGYDAAQALDKLMRGTPSAGSDRITVAAPYIATRRSTDFVASEDPQLTRALQFIRDHGRLAISVTDVARAAALSRRALEKRFRASLGRSILEEIRRIRTDHIARLLVETDLPVSGIAETLGFTDTHHFARYFRAGKQMTPVRYRRTHAPYGTGIRPPAHAS